MSISRILFFIVVMSGWFLLTACKNSTNLAGAQNSPEVETTVNIEESPPIIDVCEPIDIPDVAFPRQEYIEGPKAMMEAELIGKLELTDGCLQVDSLYGDGQIIPIWPAEYTITAEDQSLVVFDGDGNPVIRVGEEVYMGGGEGSELGMLDCVRQQLPDSCSAKYWYVGDGVRLNLKFDSDLFSMDLIPAPDRTAILLKKEPILDDWSGNPDTVTGVLRFYFPIRCPRIGSENGATDFLPIWPPAYSLQITEDLVEILDENGKVVGRQDEPVTLNGALVPANWENPNYRQLHYETPGDCTGPYWVVKPGIINP